MHQRYYAELWKCGINYEANELIIPLFVCFFVGNRSIKFRKVLIWNHFLDAIQASRKCDIVSILNS